MSRGIRIPQRVIQHIAVPIQALRIAGFVHVRIRPVLGGSGGSALTIPHRAVGGELLIVSGDKLFYLSWSYIAWAEINIEFRYYSPISRPNDDRDVFVSTRTPVI